MAAIIDKVLSILILYMVFMTKNTTRAYPVTDKITNKRSIGPPKVLFFSDPRLKSFGWNPSMVANQMENLNSQIKRLDKFPGIMKYQKRGDGSKKVKIEEKRNAADMLRKMILASVYQKRSADNHHENDRLFLLSIPEIGHKPDKYLEKGILKRVDSKHLEKYLLKSFAKGDIFLNV